MIRKYKNDIILLSVILFVAIIAILFINVFRKKGSYVMVVVNQIEVVEYSLNEDIEVNLSDYQQNGYNILVIKDGFAYIKEASCKDHICVNHNKVKYVGETITCLPNKTVIKITGDKQEIDVYS